VILLNEVDLGMKRSGYAGVARELADTLRMNYAFGVEFVEVDPLYTGDERTEMKTPEETQALADDLRADPARFRGLHGNAILTRFPLRSGALSLAREALQHATTQSSGWLMAEHRFTERVPADRTRAKTMRQRGWTHASRLMRN
jgi:hypothetical protein